MAAVVIRNLPEATHRALKQRAKRHGRSTEAEIRDILVKTVKPEDGSPENIGDALLAIGRRYGGIDLDISRDKTPIEPVDLE